MKFSTIFLLFVFSILSFHSVLLAQKPHERRNIEIVPNEIDASYRIDNMRVNRRTGVPVALYKVNYKVDSNSPLNMARQYLKENQDVLMLKNSLHDIVHTSTKETPGGYHVRFLQYIDNYPVYKSEIVVNINAQNLVTFVMNGYKPDIELNDIAPSLSVSNATQIAKDYLNIRGKLDFEKSELMVYYLKGHSRLVYRISIVPAQDVLGDWEVMVDASSGELIKAVDNSLYGETHSRATGTGWVFDPDPLTRAGANYQTGGQFGDNNDNDTDSLVAQIVQIPLLDITYNGSLYELNGPYAHIVDWEAPFKGVFSQADSNFHYTRNPDNFEAANVYYHVDKSMRYINETLGFNLMPFQYTGGVQVDPHGFNGDDNSHYISSTGRISWGEGGVDDSEDEDVILHELGHGIHDWITNGSLSQVEGLSEGCGDYWAVSYNRSSGFWQPSDPQYNWVFQWDGHNEFWSGRVTNYSAHYPGGLTGVIHTDGQIWASTLMQIWDDIGREATDSDFLEALSMTSGSTNQEDAAQAFIQADINLYNGVHLSAIEYWFTQRGYNVSIPAPLINHIPLLDTEDLNGPYLIQSEITSGTPLETVQVIYGTDGIFTDTLDMIGVGNQYSASMPGTGLPTNYNYYIFVSDSSGITSTSPAGAPANYHHFYAGADTIPPVISHSPLHDQPYVRWPSIVKAQIEDNLGIENAWVEYSVNNGAINGSFSLSHTNANWYEGSFNIDTTVVSIGDSIEYRIIAEDSSSQVNQTSSPETGHYRFKIIEVLGLVLVIDDDPTTAVSKMTEKGLVVRDIEANPFGISANRMAANLDEMGYLTVVEDANITDPINWDNYDLIISSSGINETTLDNSTYRNALITYAQNGGKFIIEGGEVGWDWRNDPGVMNSLLHSGSWGGDNVGTLNLISTFSNHPIVNEPNVLPHAIPIVYTGYGSEDAMSATDSYVVYETTTDPGYAGISIYDDTANPMSAQSVYYAFNFAQLTDTAVAKKLLDNTLNYLLTPETANQSPMIISPMADIQLAEDDPDFDVADLDTVFSDPEGDTLAYTATGSSSSIMPSIDSDNMLSISLTENWFGSATVYVMAQDNFNNVTDTIEVEVTPVNDAPELFSLLLPANEDTINILNLVTFSWNESFDVDGDTLAYSLNIFSATFDTLFAGIEDSSFAINGSGFLQANNNYQWTVSVNDGDYTTVSSDTFSFLTEAVMGIDENFQSIPQRFSLHQNYPNPFNPSTLIRYDLPQNAIVELNIYNVLGQEVKTLVNEIQEAGYKSIQWDGTNNTGVWVSSGIYLYRIGVKPVNGNTNIVQSRKMLILK